MKKKMRLNGPLAPLSLAALSVSLWPINAFAQTTQNIRIATFNILGDGSTAGSTAVIPGIATVLEGIGQQKYVGDNILELPDVIALQETYSNSVNVVPLANQLNSYYGSNIYASSPYQGTFSGSSPIIGNGPNALIYNQNRLNLVASVGVGTPQGTGNGEFRQVVRYALQPIADKGTSNGIFYVYDSHYKSGSASTTDGGITIGTLRNEEAQIIRNDEAANLPANAAVLYVGDYNVDGSTEAMYQTLTAVKSPSGVSQGQAFDPLNPTDNYTQNWSTSTFQAIMTDSDTKLSFRDDIQTMTGNIYNGTPGNLDYIPNSYHAFGNNGTTGFNGNTHTTPATTNTSLNDIVGNGPLTPSQIFAVMTNAGNAGSDHLPVVADYNIALIAQNLTWNNTGTTLINDGVTWDVNNFLNWNNGANTSTYTDGSSITFNDVNNNHYSVTLNSTVNPGSITVNNNAGNYSISGTGAIAGTASMVKTGVGSLTLSTANTFSGGVTISNGTLIAAYTVSSATASSTGTGLVNLNGGVLASAPSVTSYVLGSVIGGAASHTIAPGGIGSIGSLVIGGITSTGFTTLNFDLGSGSGEITNGDLLTLGNQTINIASGTALSFAGSPVLGDDYRLIGDTSSGAAVNAISLSNFQLPTAPVGLSFSLSHSVDPGFIDLVVVGSGPANLTWADTTANHQWDMSSANWTSSQIYSDGSNVTFDDTAGAGHFNVSLNTTVNPGSVIVNNGANDYTISGTGSISGTTSLTKSGTGTLTLFTPNNYTGGTNVTAGTLVIEPTTATTSALPAGPVSITGGTLVLATNVTLGSQSTPTPASNVNITSLTITGNGTLDINNNHIIINYGSGPDPIASIAALIASGYAGGTWTGVGITSSAAASNSTVYGIGYADAADIGNPAGLASGQIEIEYTLLGDANLDGKVNGTDFAILSTNFNQSVSGWDGGDFNYDGKANGSDFAFLATNFNQGASQGALDAFALANGLLADVPEPASAAVIALAASGILMRRSRGRVRR